MGFEVACASCGGRMMVEHPGSIIACPHCNEQLESPKDETTDFVPEESAPEMPGDSASDATRALNSMDDSISFPGLPEDPFDSESISPNHKPIADLSSQAEGSACSVEDVSSPRQQTETSGTSIETVAGSAVNGIGNSSLQISGTIPPANSRTVSRSKYVMVASYASAVTIAFVFYLWITLGKGNPHQLESLPDVIPKERASGEIERIVVSEGAQMPKGHTLRLGQSQRFGNLMVTPYKVTREPLEFVHLTGAFTQRKPPTEPVLKLWLRFENVSDDQEIMPLGSDLLFHRGATDRYPEKMRANNFVCRLDEKHDGGNHILMYDHVIDDVWNLKGQNLERGLKPGEMLNTYLPSAEEGIDELTGELVWRVHLRKGLNQKTGKGVTTLIEVEFHSDDIGDESFEKELDSDETILRDC